LTQRRRERERLEEEERTRLRLDELELLRVERLRLLEERLGAREDERVEERGR